jgi:D-sedoheptulose 7-phosphate isomerase
MQYRFADTEGHQKARGKAWLQMTITSTEHFAQVQNALHRIDTHEIDHVADLIETAKMIVTCGNGGSAATAIHFAADLRSLGLPAFDLLSPSKVTQIDNDAGHVHVFRNQALPLEALVIAFSGSGTSENIEYLAYAVGERMVLFSSEMKPFKYPGVYVLRVDSKDYEVIEDVHLAMCHAIKKELKARVYVSD